MKRIIQIDKKNKMFTFCHEFSPSFQMVRIRQIVETSIPPPHNTQPDMVSVCILSFLDFNQTKQMCTNLQQSLSTNVLLYITPKPTLNSLSVRVSSDLYHQIGPFEAYY